MSPSSSRAALRGMFYVGGLVATIAGLHTVAVGAKSLPGRQRASAAVESELRFYGAFYVAYGLAVLRVASRADRDPVGVRAVSGALFFAGLARLGGWLAAGTPHPGQLALLAIEVGAPAPIIAWQARLAAAEARPDGQS